MGRALVVAVYVILFRGVGGATQLPTAPLRAALTEAGFDNVATYINSGNAVVRSRLGRAEVVSHIVEICRKNFGFAKAVYAPTLAEWVKLIEANPFSNATTPGALLHAALLERSPEPKAIASLEALAVDGDRFAVVGGVAYIHTPNGFSNSKLAARFDKTVGVPNTARNWNTVLKLRALAEKAAA